MLVVSAPHGTDAAAAERAFCGPGPNVAISQFRLSGMYSAFVCGLNAIARQLLNPAVLGQMSSSTPICGIFPGR